MIEGYNTCSLEPTLGVILGANGYKIYVEEKLFAPLMKQEKCFKEKIEKGEEAKDNENEPNEDVEEGADDNEEKVDNDEQNEK